MKRSSLLLFALVVLLSACKKDEDPQDVIDDSIIQEYLAAHPNIKATKHASGLYYQILAEGSQFSPSITSKIEVTYKGYLTNGSVFDQTINGATYKNYLYNLIKGWQIGIPLLKKGGRILLIIPSQLGYGSRAAGSIPANSVLIFEIGFNVV